MPELEGKSRRDRPSQVYPAPTIVVGVGRTGLAVLERLGEDWEMLNRSGADESKRNLRLLHIRPAESDLNGESRTAGKRHNGHSGDRLLANHWRLWERTNIPSVAVACFLGESDLPTLALNFLILRSLGLVRFRDGTYQVALPTDAGVVENRVGIGPLNPERRSGAKEAPLVRRRFFRWINLHPDPLVTAERLYRVAEQSSELDLFITPLINRVRQGHSPRVLLDCIARCRALDEGRDPSPWRWVNVLRKRLQIAEAQRLDVRVETLDQAKEQLGLRRSDFERQPETPLLESFVPPPVESWTQWWKQACATSAGEKPVTLDLSVPPCFAPRDCDELGVELKMQDLLRVDWETTGWATGELSGRETVSYFDIVDVSLFRLGFFDKDETSGRCGREQDLPVRFKEFAQAARRGLVRLWVELNQEKVEESSTALDEVRRRKDADATLRQSLEILNELLVKPLAERERETADRWRPPREQGLGPFPYAASKFLRQLNVETPGSGNAVTDRLTDRLVALGLEAPGARERNPVHLLENTALSVADINFSRDSAIDGSTPNEQSDARGLLRLRWLLNRQVRSLFGISFLNAYRNRPIRRPPRLTIYVVGDMADPFVRASYRTLLREIHAELLRSFSPIFDYFREGFDRALSVVPIIWMPHPADPFEGGKPVWRQYEEAAIIHAVQATRRWVESVIPAARRRISQIFINSRVTDTSVLSNRDAVRQTRDFIAFQCRNETHADEWLRRTAVGPYGNDFFSTFSCYEIEFPAEKAREYLSNRLGRSLLEKIQDRRETEEQLELPEIDPPEEKTKLETAKGGLGERTAAKADELAKIVVNQGSVLPETSRRDLESRFGDTLERAFERKIQEIWLELSQGGGEMDEMIVQVRRQTATQLTRTLDGVRKRGDELIVGLAATLGIEAVLAYFNDLRIQARKLLEEHEKNRRNQEQLCGRHAIPGKERRVAARQAVLEAARAKPDLKPMQVGGLLWLVLAPALGGPLCQAVALYFELHMRPNWLEPILGSYGLITGGLLAGAAGIYYLYRGMQRAVRRVRDAIDGLTDAVRQFVRGLGGPPRRESPSIRSFFETRLDLSDQLADRSFALRVFERVETDKLLADRILRSIETQDHILQRRAENLGVRPTLDGDRRNEDLNALFTTRTGERLDTLIHPRSLTRYFDRHFGLPAEIAALVHQGIERAGGFHHWRSSAPLADTAALLGFTREQFSELVEDTVARQPLFADEAGQQLVDFVASYFANIGFGAKFVGSEGLDPDGVHVTAEASLVVHPELERLFSHARNEPGVPMTTRTMDVFPRAIRPNSAYMLSLAQGIRPHTVRNLKRFESFHDRSFTFFGYQQKDSINLLTAHADLGQTLLPPRPAVPGLKTEEEPEKENPDTEAPEESGTREKAPPAPADKAPHAETSDLPSPEDSTQPDVEI